MIRFMTIGVMALIAATDPAIARDWAVDAQASSLGFRTSQAGSTIEGRFERFAVQELRFDPSDPAAARLRVTVDLASVRTGDAGRDRNVTGADWFNVPQAATATFEANGASRLAAGRYAFEGVLALRGVQAPVTLMAQIAVDGAQARARGTAEVDRLAFGVGSGADAGARWVPRTVALNFTIAARGR